MSEPGEYKIKGFDVLHLETRKYGNSVCVPLPVKYGEETKVIVVVQDEPDAILTAAKVRRKWPVYSPGMPESGKGKRRQKPEEQDN